MLQEGIAVTAGSKKEEWILSEVEEFGLNNLFFMVKGGAGDTNLSAMLARGEVRHIVADTVVLADFRSNLPNPDDYFISYITKFSFPVAFALRPYLADNLKDEIDIAITELYADGSIETLFSPVSRLDRAFSSSTLDGIIGLISIIVISLSLPLVSSCFGYFGAIIATIIISSLAFLPIVLAFMAVKYFRKSSSRHT